MLDICCEVHAHNVKLKAEVSVLARTANQPTAPEDDGPEPCMSPFRENYDPNQHAAPTRTEAEQAVLDAWGQISVYTLHMWATHPSDHVHNTCRAELARRGLK
jgi:hypothetical protein